MSNILKGNLLEVVFSLALSSCKRKASDARVKTKLKLYVRTFQPLFQAFSGNVGPRRI